MMPTGSGQSASVARAECCAGVWSDRPDRVHGRRVTGRATCQDRPGGPIHDHHGLMDTGAGFRRGHRRRHGDRRVGGRPGRVSVQVGADAGRSGPGGQRPRIPDLLPGRRGCRGPSALLRRRWVPHALLMAGPGGNCCPGRSPVARAGGWVSSPRPRASRPNRVRDWTRSRRPHPGRGSRRRSAAATTAAEGTDMGRYDEVFRASVADPRVSGCAAAGDRLAGGTCSGAGFVESAVLPVVPRWGAERVVQRGGSACRGRPGWSGRGDPRQPGHRCAAHPELSEVA